MRPIARRATGFTLMEVILVLIVGATLLAGGTLMYNQMRENAGAAAARAKVGQLHGVIEKLAAANNNNLPTPESLRAAWIQTRQDALNSPWGGKAQCGGGDCADGIRHVEVCKSDADSRCFDNATFTGDSGVLVYLRYYDRVRVLPPYLDVWDNSQKLYAHTAQFAVAAENPDGRQFYFVQGPADYDDQGKPRSPDSTRGKYGNCGCFDGLIDQSDQYGR